MKPYRFHTALIGHAVFIALIALAWQHAALRMSFADSGFQFFKWVNNDAWNVEAHRYTAILPQLLVKVFRSFGAGLPGLMLVASVTHVLVGYAVFLVCLYVLKAPNAALGAALAAILCTRLTFYAPVIEANYLLSYPFLFFGLVESNGRQPLSLGYLLAVVASITLVVLANPLGWVILALGLAIVWSAFRPKPPWFILLLGLILALGLAARIIFPPTQYEQGMYAQLLPGAGRSYFHEHWFSWDHLVGHTFIYTNSYLPALLIFVGSCATYAYLGLYRTALVVFSAVSAYLIIALVAFRSGDDAVMMDRGFLPLATLIALGVAHLPTKLNRGQLAGATLILFVAAFLKIRDISFASRDYRKQFDRIVRMTDQARNNGLKEVVLTSGQLRESEIRAGWALPFTSVLISSLKGADMTVLISPEPEAGTVGQGTPTWTGTVHHLNDHYFDHAGAH